MARQKGKRVRALALSGVAAFALAWAMPAAAQEGPGSQPRVEFQIPSQSLGSALSEFARQSGRQLLYSPDIVAGRTAPAVVGELQPLAALERLLAGSGLQHSTTRSGAILVQDPNSPTELGAAEDTAAPSEDNGATAEILVVGRRTLNADIRRSEDDIQPYVVIDRAAIERSGAHNLEGLLRDQAPMAAGRLSAGQTESENASSSIDLRGLGEQQTLILVDGRRIASQNERGETGQPDLNGIPLLAIERIEILPTTASGIYGGSATGGVVNIILRRDFSGAEAQVSVGDTLRGDFGNRRFDLSAGTNLNDGRTNVLFSASYSDADELLVSERGYYDRAVRQRLANDPGAYFSSSFPPLGGTTNIRSTTGANLTLKPAFGGGAVGSPITFVPYGYAGPGSDNGQGLIDNAGLYNFDLADTAARISGGQRSLLSAPTTTFADLAIRHRLSDWLDAFVEVAHTRRESEFMAGPSGTITLTAANPGNPFNQSIRIAVPFVGADGVTSSESEDTKIVLGAVFDLFASWRGAFDHTWDQSSSRGVSIAGSLDGGQVTAVRAGAIDAFRDVNAFATDFSPFLQPTTTFGPGETTFESTALRLSGPLPLRLPGGGVTMSILLEHRKDELGRYTISSATSEDVIFGRSQTVDAVYAEALLPIISPQNHIPGIHALDAQLAVRAERYDLRTSNRTSASIPAPETHVESEFDSTNPTLGLRWMPSADLMVRASYGEGFLPPALSLFVADAPFVFAAGDIPSFYGVTDPSRGGELIGQNNEVSVRGGGSLTLRPEHSETVSAGFVLTPRFVDGFRFSADWTRIDKTDNIASPLSYTAQADVDFLLQFAPERVTRSTDPSTLGAFTVGPIVGIDVSPINVATARSEAIDFNVEQRLETPWGQLSLQGRATHTLEVSSQLSPIAPEFDNAGRVDAPDWRANASLTLEHGGLTVSWTVNYVGDYFVNFDQSFNVQQGSDKVDEQTYQDLFVSYQFGEMGNALANVQLVAGVRNIFDEAPPIDMNSDFNTIGNYSPWGDARGASYYVSLRKAF